MQCTGNSGYFPQGGGGGEEWPRTVVPHAVGEDHVQVLVVRQVVQDLLQAGAGVLEAGEEEAEQTRPHHEGHQRLRHHLQHDEPVEAVHRSLKNIVIFLISACKCV